VILYLDTSALVKLFVQEDGSDLAVGLVDAADVMATSRLAYVETRAALAAAARARRLTRAALRSATTDLDRRWDTLGVVEVTQEIAQRAAALAETRALRGFDALHLASALAIADDEFVLATWDEDLALAALAEGLAVAPTPT